MITFVRTCLTLVLLAVFGAAPARAAETLPVVATFSILADLVKNVGGERVAVTSLVGPDGDAHVYAPSPSDAKALTAAKVIFVNGLGFEGWIARLVQASGTRARVVVASRGVAPRLESEDGRPPGPDPHAWQSVGNAEIYVANIRDALVAADPAGKATYERNAAAYLATLSALDREVRDTIARIPPEHRRIITTHDAFGYFGAAYGVGFIAPEGVSTDSEPSARDMAQIIAQIRRQKIPAVFLENVTDPRLLERIAAESGARVGGTLYSDALTGPAGDAPTYVAMMRHNVKALAAALAR
jgi:zinc/manganese transport system substrate-binding protein